MSNATALWIGIGLVLFALAILWFVNRPEKPRMVRTPIWQVSHKPTSREYVPHRPTWMAPASKGIGGRMSVFYGRSVVRAIAAAPLDGKAQIKPPKVTQPGDRTRMTLVNPRLEPTKVTAFRKVR